MEGELTDYWGCRGEEMAEARKGQEMVKAKDKEKKRRSDEELGQWIRSSWREAPGLETRLLSSSPSPESRPGASPRFSSTQQ